MINIFSFVGETLQVKEGIKLPERRNCSRCGFVSSQEICKACIMLEGLNRGLPKLGIGKSTKVKRALESIAKVKCNDKCNGKCKDNERTEEKDLEF